MRKVKVFDDYFEIYDNGVLTDRLSSTTSDYPTLTDHLSALNPPPDKVVDGNIPEEVTIRQAKLALLHSGLLDDIEAAILSLPNDTFGRAARIEWEYATVFNRNSEIVKYFATNLNLTEDDLDNLFKLASTF